PVLAKYINFACLLGVQFYLNALVFSSLFCSWVTPYFHYKLSKGTDLSQLTVIALILLVAGLWKFGPWNRRRRILSYEFPIGWWLHVGRIASDYESWTSDRKSRFMDYVRLFVDRIEFLPSSSLEDEFEIKHRIAFATQAFLLFGHMNSDPIAHIEKFYVQRSSREPSDSIGLP